MFVFEGFLKSELDRKEKEMLFSVVFGKRKIKKIA